MGATLISRTLIAIGFESVLVMLPCFLLCPTASIIYCEFLFCGMVVTMSVCAGLHPFPLLHQQQTHGNGHAKVTMMLMMMSLQAFVHMVTYSHICYNSLLLYEHVFICFLTVCETFFAGGLPFHRISFTLSQHLGSACSALISPLLRTARRWFEMLREPWQLCCRRYERL